ncbi:hypothetical protein [Exiguobacterium aurantiacum]|uniref:SIR2-like domain-containing protein n=1 Tax=Exiguobacterium aurantiacum TaxID=33987 RepID=A0A377FWS9_9BACL|nr:hypothetical protein [Exiguobacterium aurantiacum]STO09271.1 Uncharacterised protein [Exiguobacterium aurantiacum]
MSLDPNWEKPSLSRGEGSKLIGKWLDEAKNKNGNLLFICGAGISMTGISVAPTGRGAGEAYENYLRIEKGASIPSEVTGDIAKLYEYFCYPMNEDGEKSFSQESHNEFISAITDSNHSFEFSGKPNFQHKSLVNEVLEAKGSIRVYSLNMDEFFEVATTLSSNKPEELIVNAADLVELPKFNKVFRDWNILAAHGKNIKNQQSVWSQTLLSKSIYETVDKHLTEEKKILEMSMECLLQAPYFKRVVFVGLAAPLTYLIEKLREKLEDDFEWAWINPYTEPQKWLLSDPSRTFNEENGEWIKAGLTDCLWTAYSNFYKKWFSVTCQRNIEDIPLLDIYPTPQRDMSLVEQVYRGRRIYDLGFATLTEVANNIERLHEIDADKDVYQYPQRTNGNQYHDAVLGASLHKLFEKGIKLTNSGADENPKLTIAVKVSETYPVSAHILKVNNKVPENIIANGISKTFESIILNPDHRHIIVIDNDREAWPSLIRAIEQEMSKSFPKDYNLVSVVFSEELDEFISNTEFKAPPARIRRP